MEKARQNLIFLIFADNLQLVLEMLVSIHPPENCSHTHLEASSHKLQHNLVPWPQSVCLWSRCHFYWSRQYSPPVSGCLMTPQHDPRLRMELNAGRCGPEEREPDRGRRERFKKRFWQHQSHPVSYSRLTSTSSPVVYISSLIKSMAADSPHTWISSAQRPAHKQRKCELQKTHHAKQKIKL